MKLKSMNAVFTCALLVVGGFGRAKSGDSNSGSSEMGRTTRACIRLTVWGLL